MGNPLAPTLANFFLGYLETNILSDETMRKTSAENFPAFYVRYVDDIFCVFRKGVSHHHFLSKLNTLHPNLSFTVEVDGTTMPFLDIQITLDRDQARSTVYRKKTNTDVLMHYRSTAPSRWKIGLIKWFLYRARTVCSNQSALDDEVDKLREMFHKNGYPKPFFDRITNEYFRSDDQEKEVTDTPHLLLKVPYVGRPTLLFSKRIKHLVRSKLQEDLRITYRTEKVGDHFMLKDHTPKAILSKVVYSFQCPSDLGTQYIGFTTRTLQERINEHRRGDTAIAEHTEHCKNCTIDTINLDNFTILKKCRTNLEARIFEAIFINRKNPSLNVQLVKPGITHTLLVFT